MKSVQSVDNYFYLYYCYYTIINLHHVYTVAFICDCSLIPLCNHNCMRAKCINKCRQIIEVC